MADDKPVTTYGARSAYRQRHTRRSTRVPHNYETGWHGHHRRLAWQAVMVLVTRHGLDVDACLRYMCQAEEADILRGRFLRYPPETYEAIGARTGRMLEAVEASESRGLLRLLARLVAYDAAIAGMPVGVQG